MPRAPLARTTVRDALDSAAIGIGAAGSPSPRLDAEVLLADVLGVDRAALIAHPERELEPDEARRFAVAAMRRRDREPVAYILGRRGFRRLELDVDARVLVPQALEAGATFIALEVGLGQAGAVGELLAQAGFGDVETVRDLAGIERVVVGRRAP